MAIAGAVAHVGSRFWPCLVALGRQCGLQPPHWRNAPAARCRSQADEPRAIGKTRATGVPGVRVCANSRMPLNKMGGGDGAPDPTAHMGEERGGISAGDCRLLVALRPIARRPVVDPLIEVYERVTALPVRRRRRYRARPCPSVEADQDEAGQMSKGPLICCDQLSLLPAAVNGLLVTVSPQLRSFGTGELQRSRGGPFGGNATVRCRIPAAITSGALPIELPVGRRTSSPAHKHRSEDRKNPALLPSDR